jgi:DNA-binding transcriptional ArsR family regulator
MVRARPSASPATATASGKRAGATVPAREKPARGKAGLEKGVRRSAVPDLDRLIHERLRLAIVSALAANESLSFRELKTLLQASDGNLSVHARKLEDAGYVATEKSFERRVPKTQYRLTAEGRRAFVRYLNHLEALVESARASASAFRDP